ncbi:cupin-like domain-domain-containing protein [Catenaria anguillulae PL171]|uniref:Cupin-like domain-domain-containing protein n=1 Tax=Catenaria anguillulae PL171 TaxID=765915 RepID=A0A1Y2I1Y6_9FUNG|nr:cupin-like domain-domain-containing protein [Catenaria anguillulae PL171]
MTRKSKSFQKRTGNAVWTFTPIGDTTATESQAAPSTAATNPNANVADFVNDYTGFHPPSSSWTLPRIPATSLTASDFFTRFIATRTPCVLTTSGTDAAPEWTRTLLTQWQSLKYLRSRAGDQKVMVEEAGQPGVFGTSKPRVPSTFGAFLDRVEGGDTGVYLTTQYAKPEDDEANGDHAAIESIFPAPLPALVGDFPPVPPPFATLVPQQLNLWIGTAPDKASSGLHHDYADNLYVLIKGRKRFTLYSPKDTACMDLHGKVKRVHANGLIAYEDGIRGDGAYVRDVARWKVEQLQERIERAGRTADTQDEWDVLEQLEQELDAAMVEAGETGIDVGGMGSDEDGDMDSDDESIDEEEGTSLFPPVDAPSESDSDSDSASDVGGTPSREPPSFSRIPTSALHPPFSPPRTQLHSSLLAKATQVQVTLEQGDMLYLPASWFHEVTSWSDPGDVHMALNYWMHPPTTDKLEQPYQDGFWSEVWEPVKRKVDKMVAGKGKSKAKAKLGKVGGGRKRTREAEDVVFAQSATPLFADLIHPLDPCPSPRRRPSQDAPVGVMPARQMRPPQPSLIPLPDVSPSPKRPAQWDAAAAATSVSSSAPAATRIEPQTITSTSGFARADPGRRGEESVARQVDAMIEMNERLARMALDDIKSRRAAELRRQQEAQEALERERREREEDERKRREAAELEAKRQAEEEARKQREAQEAQAERKRKEEEEKERARAEAMAKMEEARERLVKQREAEAKAKADAQAQADAAAAAKKADDDAKRAAAASAAASGASAQKSAPASAPVASAQP